MNYLQVVQVFIRTPEWSKFDARQLVMTEGVPKTGTLVAPKLPHVEHSGKIELPGPVY
jgi:hypothetical protein